MDGIGTFHPSHTHEVTWRFSTQSSRWHPSCPDADENAKHSQALGSINHLIPLWELHSTSLYTNRNERKTIQSLPNSMEQSRLWQADSRSTTPEISRLLWYPKIYNSIYKNPTINYLQLVKSSNFYLTFLWNLISFDDASKVVYSLEVLRTKFCMHLLLPYAESHTPSSDHCNNIWWTVQIMNLLSGRNLLTFSNEWSPWW